MKKYQKPKIYSILNQKVLKGMKKNKFNGKLIMKWRNGSIIHFYLSSNIKMTIYNKEDFGSEFFNLDDDSNDE